MTGRKETDKFYFRHTNGRPGGGKMEALRDLRQVSQPGGALPGGQGGWGGLLAKGSAPAEGGARPARPGHAPGVRPLPALSSRLQALSRAPAPRPPTPPTSPAPPLFFLQRLPERILEKCVKGMLPKGRIASPLFNHLKVRRGRAATVGAWRPKRLCGPAARAGAW